MEYDLPKLSPSISINDKPDYPRLNNVRKAYIGFIENWDENELDNVKQIKTLALDDNDNVICEISFAVSKRESVVSNLKRSLEVAKEKHGSKVFLGQNQPFKHVNPTYKDKELARKFVECSKDVDIPIVDQLIVSPSAFYSYAENGLR